MKKKALFWMVAFCFVLFAAWPMISGGKGTDAEPQFSKQKNDLEGMLSRIGSLANKIDSRKIITIEDDKELNELLDDYAEKVNALDEQASKDKQMNQQFMELLNAHHRKVKALQPKFSSIESQAKSAKIVPDRPFLQRLSSTELQKYKSFLSSEGLNRVKQMYPEIFNKQPSPEPVPETDGMMSGPNADAPPDEYRAPSALPSAAAAGCYSDYLHCREDCNNNLIKWVCKLGCLLLYIGCKCS